MHIVCGVMTSFCRQTSNKRGVVVLSHLVLPVYSCGCFFVLKFPKKWEEWLVVNKCITFENEVKNPIILFHFRYSID